MTDYIKRSDAIEAVCRTRCGDKAKGCPAHSCLVIEEFDAIPSAETHEIRTETHGVCLISKDDAMGAVQDHFNANGFKGYDDGQKMMDRIKALPSADAVDVAHDIPEYCRWSQTYTNMVQSAMADTKSADAEQGFRGGKIPPKEMLDGTVLIPKHQWLEMERELAELKEKFESADAVPHRRLIDADKLKSYIDCGHLRPPTEVCFSELDVCNMIDKAPTVSADAVQGEWKQEYRKTANGVDFCVIACSECDYYDAQMHYYNYCPSCGARMENK